MVYSIDMENWKKIASLNDLYEVSDRGRVRVVENGRILSTPISKNGNGYRWFNIDRYKRGGRKHVHRAIAECFVSNTDNKPQVNHIDGDKLNNSIENLEWVTNQENSEHRSKVLVKSRGEGHGRHKLSEDDILFLRMWGQSAPASYWASHFGVNPSTITRALNGKYWSHI